ncbi:MAG: hypothetical protein QOH12_1930 [Solirubrobacteraceae bacterium]|jgi:hypothetical protein|nr:hypothetical protein [Solirubrobacteraceae bacterium]
MFAHVFAGIPVASYTLSQAWYAQFVGRPPDLLPSEDEAAWQMSQAGWLCLVADVERAGSAAHTLIVDDLDAFLAGLSDRGIAAGPVETMGGNVRFTLVTDPDGNRLTVGQPAVDSA